MNVWQWLAGSGADEAGALRFAFDAPVGVIPGLALVAAAGLLWVVFSRKRLARLKPPVRWILTGTRALILMLAVFLALQPVLVGNRFDPTRGYLLMLFDNSRSMSLADSGGASRSERMQQALAANQEALEEVLARRYQIARYGFGGNIQRIRQNDALTFDRPVTDPSAAVTAALEDFQGIDVAAVLLFSDGAAQPDTSLPESIPVPVIAIGVGEDNGWRDLALESVSTKRSHGDNRPVSIRSVFRASGLAGRRATVTVMEDDRVLAEQTVEIAGEEETREVRLEVKPRREGWLTYDVEVSLEPVVVLTGESGGRADSVPENNRRSVLIDNRETRFRVLYFSGRPNWENKYVRRALEEDEDIELTSVIRISAAETKFVYRGKKSSLVNPLFEGFYQNEEDQPRYDEAVFLRFGGDPEDAGKGFPEKAEDLFGYDMLVMGDVEAGFFAEGQLELVREFVRKRGGSLFMLGGPHSFTEGNYEGTVIEGLLPVVLAKKRGEELEEHLLHRFGVSPTVEGMLDGSFAFDANPDRNRELWSELPELAGINHFPITRAGASVLARILMDDPEFSDSPLFAIQRYGDGRSAVLATGATWFWHMQTDTEDGRHARFWRQLTRGLSLQAPEPFLARNKQDRYVEGMEIEYAVLARDKDFNEKPGLQMRWILTGPDNVPRLVPVDESIEETAVYTTSFDAQPGLYRIEVEGREGDEVTGTLEDAILVEPDLREYLDPRYRPEYSRALASRGDGRFVPLNEIASIPGRIPWLNTREADEVRFPIWHFPGFYFLLVALLVVEWYLRRTRGHA
jgi:uncharacterized membrane protein